MTNDELLALQGQISALGLVCSMALVEGTRGDPERRQSVLYALAKCADSAYDPTRSRAFVDAFTSTFDPIISKVREAP